MKARDLRELSAEELSSKLREMQHEVSTLRFRQKSGVPVENYGKIRGMRRDVARMMTVAAEKREK